MKIVRKYYLTGCLLVMLLFSLYLLVAFYVGKQAYSADISPSDVILILGAKSYIGDNYNPCLVARVAQAVNLYNAKYAPKIVVSGGSDKEDIVNEAETMKQIALKQGVPSEDILLEPLATSTYENLEFSQKIMQAKNMKSVLIVTEPFHVARAGLVAQKLGLEASTSPAANSPCWLRNKYFSRYFLKEPLAILYYAIKGQIDSSVLLARIMLP